MWTQFSYLETREKIVNVIHVVDCCLFLNFSAVLWLFSSWITININEIITLDFSRRSIYKDEGEDDDDVNKGSDFVSVYVSFEPVITIYNVIRQPWLKCLTKPAWIVISRYLTRKTKSQVTIRTKLKDHYVRMHKKIRPVVLNYISHLILLNKTSSF